MKSHQYTLFLEVAVPSSQLKSFEEEVDKSLQYAMLNLKNKNCEVKWTLQRSPKRPPFSSYKKQLDRYNRNSHGWVSSDE